MFHKIFLHINAVLHNYRISLFWGFTSNVLKIIFNLPVLHASGFCVFQGSDTMISIVVEIKYHQPNHYPSGNCLLFTCKASTQTNYECWLKLLNKITLIHYLCLQQIINCWIFSCMWKFVELSYLSQIILHFYLLLLKSIVTLAAIPRWHEINCRLSSCVVQGRIYSIWRRSGAGKYFKPKYLSIST